MNATNPGEEFCTSAWCVGPCRVVFSLGSWSVFAKLQRALVCIQTYLLGQKGGVTVSQILHICVCTQGKPVPGS